LENLAGVKAALAAAVVTGEGVRVAVGANDKVAVTRGAEGEVVGVGALVRLTSGSCRR
jgi:hypothetical protein